MERDNRIDLVRCVGIVSVLLIHCAGHVLNHGRQSLPFSEWFSANLYNSLARAGVPLFFMVSGALLLESGSNETIGQFFRKRLSRIAIPFLVWGVVYTVYDHRGPGVFPPPAVFLDIFAKPAHYHLWFLYSIFGLYLVTPILRPLMKTGGKWYVPMLWVLTVPIIFAFETFLPVGFNPNFTRVLPVYVGFFAGGYLLKTIPLSSDKKKVCSIVLLGGWGIVAGGNYVLDRIGFAGYKGYFNDYLSIPVVAMSVAGFLLLMNLSVPSNGKRASAIRRLSACSMGIYLIHPMLLDLLNASFMPFKINAMLLHPSIAVPLTVLVVLGISMGAVLVIRKIPWVRALV